MVVQLNVAAELCEHHHHISLIGKPSWQWIENHAPARPSTVSPASRDLELWPPDSQNWSFHATALWRHVRTDIKIGLFVYKMCSQASTGRTNGLKNNLRTLCLCLAETQWKLSCTVWTAVQTVLMATFNSYGDRQISTSHKINTPELINKQFSVFDYVRERTPYTKFGRDPSTEGFLANGWNITKNIFIYLFVYNFFIWLTYRSDLLIDLYAQ